MMAKVSFAVGLGGLLTLAACLAGESVRANERGTHEHEECAERHEREESRQSREGEECRTRCPRSPDDWKTHREAWPLQSLVLGNRANPLHTYRQNDLLTLLRMPARTDASLILADQLVAAKLNIAGGSNPAPIRATLAEADALLAPFSRRLPYGVRTTSPTGRAMVAVAEVLESYNAGHTPNSCGRRNAPPVANAGPDQTVFVGVTVQLDGSRSTDADGDALRFRWRFVSVPAPSAATLSDPVAVRPTFRVDHAGTYVVELIVNDGTADRTPDTVQISTQNSRPVASAGPDQTVAVGATVILDGSASTDVDGDRLIFHWAFVQRPVGSQATLTDPSATGPAFIADLAGRYLVQLIVNDGTVDSVPDTVQIDTQNSRPVADAGPDQT